MSDNLITIDIADIADLYNVVPVKFKDNTNKWFISYWLDAFSIVHRSPKCCGIATYNECPWYMFLGVLMPPETFYDYPPINIKLLYNYKHCNAIVLKNLRPSIRALQFGYSVKVSLNKACTAYTNALDL